MLFSHRQGVTYIEHAKIVTSDGQVSFVRARNAMEQHWSIPQANLCVLLLGPGTSLSNQAAYKLADEGVVVGFTSGGGTPLWFASQSEYRPTEYCQQWLTRWVDPLWRLKTSIRLAEYRCEQVRTCYAKDGWMHSDVDVAIARFRESLGRVETIPEVLGYEAAFAKTMYKYNAQRVGLSMFKRSHGSMQGDVNGYLDSGNYLAYGLAASVLWVMGIPYAFPVTHGHTRRGALVFDLADVIKDAIVLPRAFDTELHVYQSMSDFRNDCIAGFDKHQTMKTLFSVITNLLDTKEDDTINTL